MYLLYHNSIYSVKMQKTIVTQSSGCQACGSAGVPVARSWPGRLRSARPVCAVVCCQQDTFLTGCVSSTRVHGALRLAYADRARGVRGARSSSLKTRPGPRCLACGAAQGVAGSHIGPREKKRATRGLCGFAIAVGARPGALRGALRGAFCRRMVRAAPAIDADCPGPRAVRVADVVTRGCGCRRSQSCPATHVADRRHARPDCDRSRCAALIVEPVIVAHVARLRSRSVSTARRPELHPRRRDRIFVLRHRRPRSRGPACGATVADRTCCARRRAIARVIIAKTHATYC